MIKEFSIDSQTVFESDFLKVAMEGKVIKKDRIFRLVTSKNMNHELG